MSRRESPDVPARGPRLLRILLSLFFVLHWGAVCLYLAPGTRAGVESLPGWMRPPAEALVSPVVHRAWPVARPYLELTATRQHWTLFAPWPAAWKSSIRVVPYFPREDGEGWLADTLVVRGAPEAPYPHVLHHRTYRILFNLGYEDFGDSYRPLFAGALCRSLRTADGRHPDGLALEAVWTPTTIPWEAEEGPGPYRQRLGGYACSRVMEETPEDPGAWAWEPYGLPYPVPVEGWPVVLPGEGGPGGGFEGGDSGEEAFLEPPDGAGP